MVFFFVDDIFFFVSVFWCYIINKIDYMWLNLNSFDWSYILVSFIVNIMSLLVNVILIKFNLSVIIYGVIYFFKLLIIYLVVLIRDIF